MNQQQYNTFHEGNGMNECGRCGTFLNSFNECPSCLDN